jgi:hypothetical protein
VDGDETMEELIYGILEKSLVGGAFLYLLYQFTTKFTKTQEDIVNGLTKMSETMSEISNTMSTLDERVKALEKKE